MKLHWIVLLFVLLPLLTFGLEPINFDESLSVLSSDAEAVSLGFNLTDVTKSTVTKDGETYSTHTMTDAGFTYEYGRPQLPAITRFVVVPPDVGLRLAVESSTPRIVPADYPPALFLDEEFPRSDEPYDNRDIYPHEIASMGDPVVIRGVRLVTVTTHPVQYDPISNSYIYHDNIRTDVLFTDEDPVNPAYVPSRKYRSPHFLKFLNSIAINADDVGRDDPSDEAPYVGHCLVVAHENCVEYAAEYIEWRRKSGWKMEWLSIPSNISQNMNSVKNRIEDVYEEYLDNETDPFDHIFLIGDLPRYWGNGPSPQWILGLESFHGDWGYACLEGNDDHADVAISRWAAGSRGMLELDVLRHFAYVVEPQMDDPDWFTRGAVYAQRWARNYHISLATNVRYGVTVLENLGFEDINVDINMDQDDRSGNRVGNFLVDQYNDKSNVLIGRAENYYFRNSLPGVRDNDVFPIDIYLGGHQEFSAHTLLRNGTPQHPKGCLAVTSSFGNPSTIMNSILWLEIVNGFLQHDMTFGWSRLKGLIGPVEYFHGFENLARTYRRWTAFFGDPALQYWKGVPLQVEAEFEDVISINPEHYTVSVNSDNGDVEDALVTLYAPGDIPDYDDEDYAAYSDMQKWTQRTDEDGVAHFLFDEDIELIEGTPFYVTVSGRELLPLMESAEIEQLPSEMKVAEFTIEEVDGNDDEEINPGETVSLTITGINIGDEDLDNVTATITSDSPWIEIVEGEVSFGECAQDREVDCEEPVEINIHESCPDGESRTDTRPLLLVQFTDGEDHWSSWLELSPVAPNIEVHAQVEDISIPNDDRHREFNLRIRNIGGMDVNEFSAELSSLSFGISVVQDSAHYPAIASGRSSRVEGEPFLIRGRSQAFPGAEVEMMLICTLNVGYVDTAFFSVQVGEEIDDGPMGPDNFGYYCLDDTDMWVTAPTYDWIEISRGERERDYNGISCDFEGDSPQDIGEAIVVELGFVTRYYGLPYSEITICSNGYILMGDQEFGINFQNWPLDRGFGTGCGVLAPFWDWLEIDGDAQVYYYHDEEGGRFIVEWYELEHKTGGDEELTFQAVLYDNAIHPSISGNQKILFQYRSIEDVRGGGNWVDQVPYASVGISSPDGTTGINYCFNDDYPDGAEPIEAGRALIFTTDLAFMEGVLYGSIMDSESGDPIEGAEVVTNFSDFAVTDEGGRYRMIEVPAEIPLAITVTMDGFNDSTITVGRDELLENDSLEISFDLLYPTFTPTDEAFAIQLEPEFDWEHPFRVTNEGTGPLHWTMSKELPNNADVDPWNHRESFFVGDTLDESRLKGVIFANDHFYCTGGGASARDDNFVYVLDRNGSLVDSYEQFGESRYGMGDLAWDGTLLWGGEDGTVFGFTPEGDVEQSFRGPFNPNQALAWDLDREILWISGKTSRYIAGFDTDGNEVQQLPRYSFTVYGLSYWQDDPDGYPLHIIHNFHRAGEEDRTHVHKMNPETEDTMFVAQLDHERDGRPEGAFITNQYDIYSWVFMAVGNSSDPCDRIDLWQLNARLSWYDLLINERQQFSGMIEPRSTQEFLLSINAFDLPTEPFEGYFLFEHNAIGGSDTLHINLDVLGARPPSPCNLLTPDDGEFVNGNEQDQQLFSWTESIDPNLGDAVIYELWISSGVDSVMFGTVDSTSLPLELRELHQRFEELSDTLTWWVVSVSDPDRVLSDDRFSFIYLPNAAFDNDDRTPVEFGLREMYPQPFNGTLNIRFGMDRTDVAAVRVFDLAGREVVTLLNRPMVTGLHTAIWRADNLPSGVYVVRLESGNRLKTAKVVLMK